MPFVDLQKSSKKLLIMNVGSYEYCCAGEVDIQPEDLLECQGGCVDHYGDVEDHGKRVEGSAEQLHLQRGARLSLMLSIGPSDNHLTDQ